MFETERAQNLADQITVITETMTAITEEQRRGILENENNNLARMDAVLAGVAATQTQVVALVSTLSNTFIEYLLDQKQQRDLGIDQ